MKQKLLTVLFFVLFIGIFWYFYGGEYREFYETQKRSLASEVELREKIQSFSVDVIPDASGSRLFITPDTGVLDGIVQMIDDADTRVYLEVYIFTEKRILKALKNAHGRWVDVRVILERNPYLAPNLNNKRFNELQVAGIPVVWSDSDDYALNHSKLLIIDDRALISTWNMSYSTFTKNRDFLVEVSDPSLLETLLQVFDSDYKGIEIDPYHESLVLSPNYSRAKLEQLIEWAEDEIYMYFQYIQDDGLEELLVEKSQQWVDIHMVLDDDFFERDQDKVSYLREQWIKIYEYPKSVMHAKAILVDKRYLFIGSINFSYYSISKNREVGVILRDESIIRDFVDVFLRDSGL